LGPTTHSVVVEIENLGDLFAAQAVVQKQHGVRAARQPMRSRPVSHQSDKGGAVWRRKETGANHAPRRIDFSQLGNHFFRRLNESRYSIIFRRVSRDWDEAMSGVQTIHVIDDDAMVR